MFVSLFLLQFGVHIGPYKFNDIGKKLDYNEFISIDLPDDVEISETSTDDPKKGKEKVERKSVLLMIKQVEDEEDEEEDERKERRSRDDGKRVRDERRRTSGEEGVKVKRKRVLLMIKEQDEDEDDEEKKIKG